MLNNFYMIIYDFTGLDSLELIGLLLLLLIIAMLVKGGLK